MSLISHENRCMDEWNRQKCYWINQRANAETREAKGRQKDLSALNVSHTNTLFDVWFVGSPYIVTRCCSYGIKRCWRKKYRKLPYRMLSQPISLLVFEMWDVCTSGPSCLTQSRLTEMNLHRSVVVSGTVPDPGPQGETQHLPSFTVTFNQHVSLVKHGEVTLVEILIIHREKTSRRLCSICRWSVSQRKKEVKGWEKLNQVSRD